MEWVKFLPELLESKFDHWQSDKTAQLPVPSRPIKYASNSENQGEEFYPIWLHWEEEQMNGPSGTLLSLLQTRKVWVKKMNKV